MFACARGWRGWYTTPLEAEPSRWVTVDGGVVHEGFVGVSPPWTGSGALGITSQPDAGNMPINFVLATDAGRTTVESLNAGITAERRVYRLSERLLLITWEPFAPDPAVRPNLPCPACLIGGLYAEYVCLPP